MSRDEFLNKDLAIESMKEIREASGEARKLKLTERLNPANWQIFIANQQAVIVDLIKLDA